MLLKPVSTPEVAICTEKVVIPAPGAGLLFKVNWLE
jgi:hypothetical protein